MSIKDQVVWASVNVVTAGETAGYARGELLPDPANQEEADNRNLLRIGGAIRTVEVVYSPEELAEKAQGHAEAGAARASALDVDQSLPLGQQLPGTAQPGPPTLEAAGATPVVIGPEDTGAPGDGKDEEQDQDDDDDAAGDGAPVVVGPESTVKPPKAASGSPAKAPPATSGTSAASARTTTGGPSKAAGPADSGGPPPATSGKGTKG